MSIRLVKTQGKTINEIIQEVICVVTNWIDDKGVMDVICFELESISGRTYLWRGEVKWTGERKQSGSELVHFVNIIMGAVHRNELLNYELKMVIMFDSLF